MRNKGKYEVLVYNKFMWREKDLHITLPKIVSNVITKSEIFQLSHS